MLSYYFRVTWALKIMIRFELGYILPQHTLACLQWAKLLAVPKAVWYKDGTDKLRIPALFTKLLEMISLLLNVRMCGFKKRWRCCTLQWNISGWFLLKEIHRRSHRVCMSYVCKYLCVKMCAFVFTSACISVSHTHLCSQAGGVVIMLHSVCLGKVHGVITDQTAGKQSIITLWRIPGAWNNNSDEGFVGNDITLFLWKWTLRVTCFFTACTSVDWWKVFAALILVTDNVISLDLMMTKHWLP